MLGFDSGSLMRKSPWLSGSSVLVLVHSTAWGRPSAALLERMRAELRALGATLIVLSEEGLFYFRPDQDVEPIAESARALSEAAAALLGPHAPARTSPKRLTLSVLEDDGTLRFRIARELDDDVPETLLEALRLAGKNATEAGPRGSISRRELVVCSLVGALTLVLVEGCKSDHHPEPSPPLPREPAHEMPIVLNVNGQAHELRVEPRVSLLDALRERLGLYGTKKGCDHGQCGACTVLLDDRRVNACLTLAAMAQGKRITTIEGLAQGDALHPLQDAFIEEDALQCGYCTPGQIVSALGLLKENRAHRDDEIREQMSGNLCRCGAYLNIVRAIQRARKGLPA